MKLRGASYLLAGLSLLVSQPVLAEGTITVKTLTGRSIPIQFEPTETVLQVKQRVLEKEGIPPAQQRLIFAGRVWELPLRSATEVQVLCPIPGIPARYKIQQQQPVLLPVLIL